MLLELQAAQLCWLEGQLEGSKDPKADKLKEMEWYYINSLGNKTLFQKWIYDSEISFIFSEINPTTFVFLFGEILHNSSIH